ncbi:MAG: hypothetical protein K6F75_08535, partial [Butyrivibrio sp.]|nr:hypothetical protein [Butyrivibrio sp.]
FLIGSGEWDICASGLKAGCESLGKLDGSKRNTIEPLSAMILIRGDETIVAVENDNSEDGNEKNTNESNADNGAGSPAANSSATAFGGKAGVAAAIVVAVLALAGAIALFLKKKK